MTYEPLHHKYRPQTFANLVGQEAIATTLSNAIEQGHIAPAYLFTGPRGTGKTSSARIFAKSLNCLFSKVPTKSPCGECEVCIAIAKGSALDVIEIDAASNTGVDNIREIIERAQFAPVQCRYKVYVVDECHMLSTAAFNALLKTLEEPPDRVVFVLATTDPQRVLPTIISRCQRFDFRRIPLEAMVNHLQTIADRENIDISPDALTLVGQISQGGLRDAESLLDQLSLLSGQVTVERVWDLVGAVPERDLLAMLQAIAQNHASDVIEIARRLMDRGREPLIVLQNLASFYRDLLIAKTAPDRANLSTVTTPTWRALCDFKGLAINEIFSGQKHLKDSEVQIKNTTQPRLWLEVTLLGLLPSAINSQPITKPIASPGIERSPTNFSLPTHIPQSQERSPTPPAEKISANSSIEAKTSETIEQINPPTGEENSSLPTAEVPVNQNVSPPANITHGEIAIEEVWEQVLNCLSPANKALFKQHGWLSNININRAEVGIRNSNLLKVAQSRIPDLETAFQKVCDRKVKVDVQTTTPSTIETVRETRPTFTSPPNFTQAASFPETIAPPFPEIKPDDKPTSLSKPEVTASPKSETSNFSPTPQKIKEEISQPAKQTKGEEDRNIDTQIVRESVERLKKVFNAEVVELPEDLNLSRPSPTENLRSPEIEPEFELDAGLESDPENEIDF